MKVWSRDKFIQVTLQSMQGIPEADAIKLRLLVGEILTTRTQHLAFPFANVANEDDFQRALTNLFKTKTVNEIDVNTSLFLQDFKKIVSNDLERLAMNVAAAFLKSASNIATFRKKRKTPSEDKIRLYEFFAKLGLNAMIEFQSTLKVQNVIS